MGRETDGSGRVEFHRHDLGEAELQAVARVFSGLTLTSGPEVAAFESEFAAWLGVPDTVATCNCTSALTLALRCLGVGPGDEVITTSLTFVSTVQAVVALGAVPVLADVEADSGNISVEEIEKKINHRTKCIVPVHIYGHMCDMRSISALARRRGIAVVEDAAHSLEGCRDGVRPGSLSDMACFSFYATKSITCGEGGAIAVSNPEMAARLRCLRLLGIDRSPGFRQPGLYSHWDVESISGKYTLSDIQAAMLRPQLARVGLSLDRRRQLAERYDLAFSGSRHVRFLSVGPGCEHARHLYPIFVDPVLRDRLVGVLCERGIGSTVHYRPVHVLAAYQKLVSYVPGMLPNTESLGSSCLSLPLYSRLSHSEQDRVIEVVRETVSELSE